MTDDTKKLMDVTKEFQEKAAKNDLFYSLIRQVTHDITFQSDFNVTRTMNAYVFTCSGVTLSLTHEYIKNNNVYIPERA